MAQSYNGPERRKYVRIPKSYKLSFGIEANSPQKFSETQIKDIGKGGVSFRSSQNLKVGTTLVLEIAVPLIAPHRLTLEVLVIGCKEITPSTVYEIRAKFISVDDEAIYLFDTLEEQNLKEV